MIRISAPEPSASHVYSWGKVRTYSGHCEITIAPMAQASVQYGFRNHTFILSSHQLQLVRSKSESVLSSTSHTLQIFPQNPYRRRVVLLHHLESRLYTWPMIQHYYPFTEAQTSNRRYTTDSPLSSGLPSCFNTCARSIRHLSRKVSVCLGSFLPSFLLHTIALGPPTVDVPTKNEQDRALFVC